MDACTEETPQVAAASSTCSSTSVTPAQSSTTPERTYQRESFLHEFLSPSGIALIKDVIAGQIDIIDWKASPTKGSSIVS